MNQQCIRSNGRKRLVGLATLAVLFLLLAGGGNALANTVWTVSKTSSVKTCVAPPNPVTTCNNIGSAVSVASPFDVILVGPGTYKESVWIAPPDITLLGAQAGKDARVGRDDPTKESIIDASGTGYPAIWALNSDEVIDGFTIQGASFTPPTFPPPFPGGVFSINDSGLQIRNNIFQENASGINLVLNCAGVVIEHNRFTNNNARGGPYSGYGVLSSFTTGLTIVENEFTGNMAAAMEIFGDNSVTIQNNTSDGDGVFAVLYGLAGGTFSHNRGKNFGANGVKPVIKPNTGYPPLTAAADAAIDLGPFILNMEISDNDLEDAQTPNLNGMAFTTILGFGFADSALSVKGNEIKGFPGNGIVAEPSGGEGTVAGSTFLGNEVIDNGLDGILLEKSDTTGNAFNKFLGNVAQGNGEKDCEDQTPPSAPPPGGGTAGTLNTWYEDFGFRSSPAGICSPPPLE